jgi:hypothetical protein
MENSLFDAYEASGTDRSLLNQKQREYLDKIFSMAVKVCILNEEPISILSHELKAIARDVEQDPIFSQYPMPDEAGEFSEYIPGTPVA